MLKPSLVLGPDWRPEIEYCGPGRLLDDVPWVPSILLLAARAKGESTPASVVKAWTIDGSRSEAIFWCPGTCYLSNIQECCQHLFYTVMLPRLQISCVSPWEVVAGQTKFIVSCKTHIRFVCSCMASHYFLLANAIYTRKPMAIM